MPLEITLTEIGHIEKEKNYSVFSLVMKVDFKLRVCVYIMYISHKTRKGIRREEDEVLREVGIRESKRMGGCLKI